MYNCNLYLTRQVLTHFIQIYQLSLFSELVGDVLKEAPKKTDGLESIIVVDNVPVVGPDRLEKLKNVIRKIFTKIGKVVSEYYPEENEQTKG